MLDCRGHPADYREISPLGGAGRRGRTEQQSWVGPSPEPVDEGADADQVRSVQGWEAEGENGGSDLAQRAATTAGLFPTPELGAETEHDAVSDTHPFSFRARHAAPSRAGGCPSCCRKRAPERAAGRILVPKRDWVGQHRVPERSRRTQSRGALSMGHRELHGLPVRRNRNAAYQPKMVVYAN